MRDLVAAVVAAALFLGALSLATTLTVYRKRRRRTREGEQALGRRIVAEIPGDDDLRLFTADERQFHYGAESIDKDRIAAVRVLINGAPIAAYVTRRHLKDANMQPTSFEDRPEGIAREHEQEIGQTIDVLQQQRIDGRLERDHASFRTPAHGTRDMERGSARRAACENEIRQRRQAGLEPIDQMFHPLDVTVTQQGFWNLRRDLPGRIRQLRAEREQIALQTDDLVSDLGIRRARSREPQVRVQLVDVAVCGNARFVLADAGAAEERCVARIAGPRVDLHGQEA